MKINWLSLKLAALLLLLSACSNNATEAPHVALGLASVANKGAPELAQNLFAEPDESWDRVPIHWNEIELAPNAPWDWNKGPSISMARSTRPIRGPIISTR